MGGEYSMHGRDENEYKILSVRPKGKRPHGRCRHRLEDNIRMDLREVGWEGVDWTYLAQGPLVGSCEQINESLGCIKGQEFPD